MQKHDFLIVGAGLCGAVMAERLTSAGASVLVLEKKRSVGGLCATRNVGGIIVHDYGAHIFRTNNRIVWDYINLFGKFNRFTNSPIARYHDEAYNMPINMNTFHQLYGVVTPDEAKAALKDDLVPCDNPVNLEEYVLSVAGKRVYEKLIKEYTEKQWGRSCKDLPKSVMRRIPIRFTYDNNYYDAAFQGCPVEGYSTIIRRMLKNADVMTGVDFNADPERYGEMAGQVIYTGAIDALFGHVFGRLEYRSLRFQHEVIPKNNAQGVAVVNYTDKEYPYTRTIEHKHFTFGDSKEYTIVTKEYPVNNPKLTDEPYYPVNTEENNAKYEQYRQLAEERGITLAGRLAEYRYYDMQDTIQSAMEKAAALIRGDGKS